MKHFCSFYMSRKKFHLKVEMCVSFFFFTHSFFCPIIFNKNPICRNVFLFFFFHIQFVCRINPIYVIICFMHNVCINYPLKNVCYSWYENHAVILCFCYIIFKLKKLLICVRRGSIFFFH